MQRRSSRAAAFTLVEILVTLSLSGVLAAIVYGVATEALVSFAKNVSINKSYGDARLALERIAVTLQSAGHLPILVDANGAPTTAAPAAGIRFYRYAATPRYVIQGTPALTVNTLTVSVAAGQARPEVGDMATIESIGFQAAIQSVSGSGPVTMTFSGTLRSNCSPAPAATFTALTTSTPCLVFTPVAFIAVNNQLRYYPRSKTLAADGTAFNNAANYDVLATLVANPGMTPLDCLPFQLEAGALVRATVRAQAPDYSQRGYNSSAFALMQSSLSSRCPPTLVRPFTASTAYNQVPY